MKNFLRNRSVLFPTPIALSLLVALIYFCVNSSVVGPTYLHDEIGYLNNAAFLAGRHVDVASSYYAGYSIFLAPLFYFLSDPFQVWTCVLLINALMWGASIALLAWLLRRLIPDISTWTLYPVLFVVASYPGFVVMSGYAFSQTAVAFTFMAAVACFELIRMENPFSVLPHALLSGFVFWVHPTGLAVAIASILAVAVLALHVKRYGLLGVHVFAVLGMVFLYKDVIEPWRIAGMTTAGSVAELHYVGMGERLAGLFDPGKWMTILSVALGHASSALVATFGFVLLGVLEAGRRFLVIRNAGNNEADTRHAALFLLVLLALLGVLAEAAIEFGNGGPNRIDHWIYLRYLDPFLPVLFSIGLLSVVSFRKKLELALAALLTCCVAVWLVHGMHVSGDVNRVNLVGFWPEALLNDRGLLAWFGVGFLGIVAISWLPRVVAVPSMLLVYLFTIFSHVAWHERVNIIRNGNPSEIVDFIGVNFPNGCVSMDTGSSPAPADPFSSIGERDELYSFYLFSHRFRRESIADWLQGCDGPLLTWQPSAAQQNGANVVGIEKSSKLRVLVKGDVRQYRYPLVKQSSAPAESYWISEFGRACVVEGRCLYAKAQDLAANSQVGNLNSKGLAASGKAGFLFFGPYAAMPAGRYELKLYGSGTQVVGAVLDVVSGKGANVHATTTLKPTGNRLASVEFVLDNDVSDLEIRLRVEEDNRIIAGDYTLSGL